MYGIAIDRIEKRRGGSFNASMRRHHAFHDEDERSSYLTPPARDETKTSRARSFGMLPTRLHRKNLADTKAALLAVAGKDDSAVKYEATNFVVVGMDVADLVGLHFPFHNLAKTVIAQFGFKFGRIHSVLHFSRVRRIRQYDISMVSDHCLYRKSATVDSIRCSQPLR